MLSLPAEARTVLFSASSQISVREITHELLHVAWWNFARICVIDNLYTVSQKTVQNCFWQNFVKFLSTLIIFGTPLAQRIGLCGVYSFFTSPNSYQRLTVLNAAVPNCYKGQGHMGFCAFLSVWYPRAVLSLERRVYLFYRTIYDHRQHMFSSISW